MLLVNTLVILISHSDQLLQLVTALSIQAQEMHFLNCFFPNLGSQSYRRQFHWREHEVCLAQATHS